MQPIDPARAAQPYYIALFKFNSSTRLDLLLRNPSPMYWPRTRTHPGSIKNPSNNSKTKTWKRFRKGHFHFHFQLIIFLIWRFNGRTKVLLIFCNLYAVHKNNASRTHQKHIKETTEMQLPDDKSITESFCNVGFEYIWRWNLLMLGCVNMMLQSGCLPTIKISSNTCSGLSGSEIPGGGWSITKMFLRMALFFRTVNTGIFFSFSSAMVIIPFDKEIDC